MKKVALVFATRYGQTGKIMEFINGRLSKNGELVTIVLDVSKDPNKSFSDNVDMVIIGAPVYRGKFPKELVRWVRLHRDELRSRTVAFFSVSLNAADRRPEARLADDQLLRTFINAIGLVPKYVASFAGALKYLKYNWILRYIMRNISRTAGGPVDISRDYELTDWERVSSFVDAIVKQNFTSNPDVRFLTERRFPRDRNMDRLSPEFEQIWATEIVVNRPSAEVFNTLNTLEASEMKLANFLTQLRTLGQAAPAPSGESFMKSAEKFGNVSLIYDPPREIAAGLIGQFWKLGFGIRKVSQDEFQRFNEAGYSKVVSNFFIEDIPSTNLTRVYSEMRIHSTSPDAAWKFRLYWMVFNIGIHLFMRSALIALRRRAEIPRIHPKQKELGSSPSR